jgi:SAM-dependent methyltransferase
LSIVLDPLWHAIGRQLRQPSGLPGRMAGMLMRLVNDGPNRLAVDLLQIEPGDTVLELGCGPGHALELMAARAGMGVVHGLDQSPVMLNQAERRNRSAMRDGRVFLHRGGFERLPFSDGSIDRVLAVNVAYFWRDPPNIAREIRRVLSPGGRVSIYVTDAGTMCLWKFAGPETHRHYDAAGLAAVLRSGGFADANILSHTFRLTREICGHIVTATNEPASSKPCRDRRIAAVESRAESDLSAETGRDREPERRSSIP